MTEESCCGPGTDTAKAEDTLNIELLYLDLEVCDRCRGTDASLMEAIDETERVLALTGRKVVVSKVHVRTEEQARALGFRSSPTIRINGRDIQPDIKESLCESCGCLTGGEPVDCRVWTWRGKEYTSPPAGLIVESILRSASTDEPAEPEPRDDVPDNLKRCFAAMSACCDETPTSGCC